MEVWLIFALSAAMLTALTNIAEKKQLFHQHATQFAVIIAIFNLIMLSPFLLTINYAGISIMQWSLILFEGIADSFAFIFITKAVRHRPVSLSFPLMAISPAVTALIALFFIKEYLTLTQVGGVLLIVIGAYILEHQPNETIKGHLKTMFTSKYTRYMLAAVLIYGFTSVIGRILLSPKSINGFGMHPLHLIPLLQTVRVAVLVSFMYLFYDGGKEIIAGVKRSWFPLMLISILLIGSRILYVYGLTFKAGKTALVIAIRRSSILFTTFFGGRLFREGQLLQRTIASVIMIIGGILIAL